MFTGTPKELIIAITGGTGSFGRAIALRLKEMGAAEVRLFSRNNGTKWQGDIRDREAVRKLVEGVNIVIHAAALKDVHYCENNPQEATEINVYGTINLLEAAAEAGVEKVVVISTDKACYPVGTMGITKALMEKFVLDFSCRTNLPDKRSGQNPVNRPVCTIVRFGNLAGTSGTVIPLFIKQTIEGKELTVTDPQMTRFLMTLESASDLVIFALENGKNGDIIVEKAKAVSLKTLAQSIQKMYGGNEHNNAIKITGARPGEKLCETMATAEEISRSEEISVKNRTYIRILLNTPAQNKQHQEFNSHTAPALSTSGVIEILKKLSQ